MKKNAWKVLLFATIVCLIGITLTACNLFGKSNDTDEQEAGDEQPEVVPEHKHVYGDWVVTEDATCTKAGTKKKECSICGEKETEEIAVLGHNYVNNTCTRCGEKELTETVGLKFALKEDDTYEVIGYEGEEQEICILSTHEGKAVTSIGERAFYYCNGITSIMIPANVTSIGGSAFEGCTGLTSITIPESVVSIGYLAFCGCTGLTSITIPESVTKIDWEAFIDCTGIRSVYYTGDIASWCGITFAPSAAELNSNPLFYFADFYINNELVTEIEIPDTVTEIKANAFCGWNGTSITIGNSVTSIGNYAFLHCYHLVEVYNNSSLNITKGSSDYGYVGYYAKAIHSESYVSKLSTDENGYILYTDGEDISLIGYTGTDTVLTLPDGITEINHGAFYYNRTITRITIPNSVTSIRKYAFEDCTGLTNITIPDSVTSIGEYAFFGCTGLTNITIGNSVTSIGNVAFWCCYKLVEIYNKSSLNITKGIESNGYVGYYAKAIYTEPYVSKLSTDENGYILYTDGEEILLMGYTGKDRVLTLPEGITEIYQYAFYYKKNITSITIPDSVTSIGYQAFYGCTGLTSVTIGNSVTSIGEWAFGKCTGLTSITIPDSVMSIGDWSFYNCTGLTSITIPDSVTSIGYEAFYNCSRLTSITYQGTKAQWNAIEKSSDWDYNTGAYTIHCTDGDIAR